MSIFIWFSSQLCSSTPSTPLLTGRRGRHYCGHHRGRHHRTTCCAQGGQHGEGHHHSGGYHWSSFQSGSAEWKSREPQWWWWEFLLLAGAKWRERIGGYGKISNNNRALIANPGFRAAHRSLARGKMYRQVKMLWKKISYTSLLKFVINTGDGGLEKLYNSFWTSSDFLRYPC